MSLTSSTMTHTFDDLRRFHDACTLRTWIEPGEMMRYAFLNTPEFMPHALIHRDGPIVELEEIRREDVGATLVRTPLGEMTIDAYVDQAAITTVTRPDIFDRGAYNRRDLESLAPARPTHNARQWDFVMLNGDFFKGGFGGQGLYISPANDLVIAFFGSMVSDRREHALRSIAQQLSENWQD